MRAGAQPVRTPFDVRTAEGKRLIDGDEGASLSSSPAGIR